MRVDGLQYVVTQAKPFQHAGGEVLEDDVDLGDQRLDDLDPARVPEIHGHTAFTLVPLVEHAVGIERRLDACRCGWTAPVEVGTHRRLDADDVGA